MKLLNLQDAADYLETATIEHSHDAGFAVIHSGRTSSGIRFVMVNDCQGDSALTEFI